MMKKVYFIAFVLCLSLLLSFCAFATDGGVISNAKDGLTANMKLAAENENVQLDVEVINISAADVSNIAVTLTLPEAFELSSGEITTPVVLDVGSTQKLSYVITNTDALPETTVPETEPVKSGCGAVVSSTAAIFVLMISAFFLFKNPKRGAACLLACLMLVPLALPANAATTERKIVLEGIVKYEEKEYPISVTVSYDHTFTEAKGVDTKGMESLR